MDETLGEGCWQTLGVRGGCQAGHRRGRYQGEGRRQCNQDKVVLDWFSNNVFQSELFSPSLSSLSYVPFLFLSQSLYSLQHIERDVIINGVPSNSVIGAASFPPRKLIRSTAIQNEGFSSKPSE